MRLPFKHHPGSGKPGGGQLPLPAAANRRRREAGFILTFWEVLISVIIVALLFGTIINGYLATAVREEWTGYSLAAQSLAVKTIDQARAAVWDIALGKNELTNMALISASWNAGTMTYSGYMTNVLDLPYKGGNYVLATNFVTIQLINEPGVPANTVQVQSIRVDTVWPFTGWGKHAAQCYTNSIYTFIGPDNRDPSSLGATAPPGY